MLVTRNCDPVYVLATLQGNRNRNRNLFLERLLHSSGTRLIDRSPFNGLLERLAKKFVIVNKKFVVVNKIFIVAHQNCPAVQQIFTSSTKFHLIFGLGWRQRNQTASVTHNGPIIFNPNAGAGRKVDKNLLHRDLKAKHTPQAHSLPNQTPKTPNNSEQNKDKTR